MRTSQYIVTALIALGFAAAAQGQSIDQGRRLTRNEQYEDAENVFNSIIAKKPKVGDAYYYGGLNALEQGDTNGAASLFDKGVLLSPKFPLNFVGKGFLLLRQGKSTEAAALFMQAQKIKKKSLPLVNKEIGRSYLMVTEAPRPKLLLYAQTALNYLRQCDTVTDNEVQFLMGDAYSIIDPLNMGDAVVKYRSAAITNPQDPKPRLREARVYQRVKNYETAMFKIDEALALDKDFAPAYRQKAELFSEMGAVYKKKEYRDSAVIFYREYLKRNNNLSARKMFVQSLYFNGEFDDCIKEGEALLKAKEYPNLYGVIAYAIVQKSDTSKEVNQKGLDYFSKYEEKFVKAQNRPLNTTEKYFKGMLLYRIGSDGVAHGLFMDALSDTAHAQNSWYDQTFDMYYKSGSYSEALMIMELKEKKVPMLFSKDLYYKAQCYSQLKRYQDAINTFRELVQRDTTYVRGYYFMALNWAKLDPTDSTGNLTASYLEWMGHLKADDKTKYKKDIENAYKFLGYIWDSKGRTMYTNAEDKAAGWPKTKELFNTSIDYYQKYLEMNPDDKVVSDQILQTKTFLSKLGKKKGPAPKK